MEPTTFEPDIIEQANLLRRGDSRVVPSIGLEEKLNKSKRTGKPLRIKLGLDPTAPDIHLGFAVVLRKLRKFQDLGHQVVIIIGDYTTLIGDPSGRSATRPMLSTEEIQANASTYVDQLARILDRDKTEVRFNSEWLGKLDFAQVVWLTSKMTVAQVLQRDDFAKRYAANQPISMHELLYPLAQAYDSVCIEADIEMGGLDQTFNIMAGRDLQKELGLEPQIAFYMPILVGLDGVKKMSKSLGNYIGIAETPDSMFAKLMSISDEMMKDYLILCTDVEEAEIAELIAKSASGEMNPRDAKRRLGREVVAIYQGLEAADAADTEWLRVHSQGAVPTEMPECSLQANAFTDDHLWIVKLLTLVEFAKSSNEARRLITQGAVSLNGIKLTDDKLHLIPAELQGAVLKVGAKRYVKLIVV